MDDTGADSPPDTSLTSQLVRRTLGFFRTETWSKKDVVERNKKQNLGISGILNVQSERFWGVDIRRPTIRFVIVTFDQWASYEDRMPNSCLSDPSLISNFGLTTTVTDVKDKHGHNISRLECSKIKYHSFCRCHFGLPG